METLDAFITVMGAMTTLYAIIFCKLNGVFSETLAVWTEEVEQIINGKIISKETWIIKKWRR